MDSNDLIASQLEAQTIILMRIYDVMFSLLQHQNPAMAEDLLQLHGDGTILGPIPLMNGTFAFNELNGFEDDGDLSNVESDEFNN